MYRRLTIVSMAFVLVMNQAVSSLAYESHDISFGLQSLSGDNGMSFLYLEASDTHGSTPVPNHRYRSGVACPTPYYSVWSTLPGTDTASLYSWKLYRCATGEAVNAMSAYDGEMMVSNSDHQAIAGEGRLDVTGEAVYALDVSLAPAALQPGQQATLSAAIGDAFVEAADRTLNISLAPDGWSVTSWRVDFGDGQRTTLPGGERQISLTHTYTVAGDPRPTVVAHVTGMAQVADFDPATGRPVLLRKPFRMDVTNSTSARVVSQPVVGYVPPTVVAAALPTLTGTAVPPPGGGLARVEVFRGTLTDLYVRPVVQREGYMTADGVPAGDGRSSLVSWLLVAGSVDGPAAEVTAAGAGAGADIAIVQQWDLPDREEGGQAVPYLVRISYVMRTIYPDGHQRDTSFTGSVQVIVRYSADNS